MRLATLARRVVLVIGLAMLLALAWNGVSGGLSQFAESRTLGQIAQSVSQFGFGLLALSSVATVFLARRWNSFSLRCWIACLTVAGGWAPVVWADSSILVGNSLRCRVVVHCLDDLATRSSRRSRDDRCMNTAALDQALVIPLSYRTFDDFWQPFLEGRGPAGAYVASLSDESRRDLGKRLRKRRPVQPDGSIRLNGRAWAVRGVVADGLRPP